MGSYTKRWWASERAGIDVPRRDRANGAYRAYIPDRLLDRAFVLPGDVSADAVDASLALSRLDSQARTLTNTESLARLLLRAESTASSHIEGLTISPQRLLREELKRAEGVVSNDTTALEVLANIDAMEFAIGGTGDITIERLVEVHRRLLMPTRAKAYAGVIRSEQNWIGGSQYTPIGAKYVPPPPELVMDLLEDLCAFCNADDLPAVIQAAIAHAQFESIHPFADGNGRTGRALIYMVLRKRGLAIHATPPISLLLATQTNAYISCLDAMRFEGVPNSKASRDALFTWVGFFSSACVQAVREAEEFERRVLAIQGQWRNRLAHLRSDSTAFAIIDTLPVTPIITVSSAASVTGKTFNAANNAIEQLVAVGILKSTKVGTRNRSFEATELIGIFAGLERKLASPALNTQISKPIRNVPFLRDH
ncbi:MAG: Fic family protein [Candidatus Eremiobacteraeota bacterium]|nr:Fic family protein [Candidatus Eremiobacteraeota bacterium]